jgi:hypothetical protein
MDTTHGPAAILRDARKGALLRMRSEIYSQPSMRGIQYAAALVVDGGVGVYWISRFGG